MAEPVQADLSGKTCLVTGANSGIGKETVRELARMGAHVVMACRNADKGEACRNDLREENPDADLEVLLMDQASQASIRDFAERFLASHDRLDVLVNNAGIWKQEKEVTEDGHELTWATNQLGYFLLTHLLLDRLKQSAPARIVNVASRLAHSLDVDDVDFERRSFEGLMAYAQSKQANRMFTWALDRRLEGIGVTANAVHPGPVRTGLFRHFGPVMKGGVKLYGLIFGRSPAKGADTVVWAAASPELEGVSGKLFWDRKERHRQFHDPEREERLWRLCAAQTGLDAGQ